MEYTKHFAGAALFVLSATLRASNAALAQAVDKIDRVRSGTEPEVSGQPTLADVYLSGGS